VDARTRPYPTLRTRFVPATHLAVSGGERPPVGGIRIGEEENAGSRPPSESERHLQPVRRRPGRDVEERRAARSPSERTEATTSGLRAETRAMLCERHRSGPARAENDRARTELGLGLGGSSVALCNRGHYKSSGRRWRHQQSARPIRPPSCSSVRAISRTLGAASRLSKATLGDASWP
jgi:hypothetical protein